MNFIPRSILFLAFPLLFSVCAAAQDRRGPSTPDERAMAVKAARLLESDPFNADADKIRKWFTLWLIEIPDISIEVCGAYLGPVLSSKKNYSSEIFTQTMFSSAAFIIEHPDQAKDRVAVNLAGVEGALRIYESILKTRPKARWEFLDELVAKRDKGELRAYIEEITRTKCKSKV
jgi:hypothetical protein